MMGKSRFLTEIIAVVVVIALLIVAGFLFIKKNKTAASSWNLPGISQIGNVNTPSGLTGPENQAKAATLSPDKIIEWTNYYREQEKIAPLTKNDLLTTAANTKTNDMFQKQYFEHISPDGTTPAQLVLQTGYNYKATGENLALGDFTDEKDLVDAWMASPGHRANIMNPEYTEIGAATGLNDYEGRNTWLAVQEFGHQAPNCTKPNQTLSNSIDQEKTDYQKLADQMNTLSTDAQTLANQANEKTVEGNQIYASTHSKTKAQPYWDEGASLQTQSQQKMDQAKTIDLQLKTLYSQIDTNVKKFNIQVSSYNDCLKK